MTRFTLVCAALVAAAGRVCEATRVNVLAQNMQFIPLSGGSIQSQIEDAKAVGDAFLKLEGDEEKQIDIFGFTETFNKEPTDVLVSMLNDTHPHVARFFPQRLPLGKIINSGLTIVSRFPILATDFEIFRQADFPDSASAKGVLAALVQVPPASYAVVALTHQQAGGQDSTYTAQFDTGRRLIERFVGRNIPADAVGHTAVVYMGDFNVDFQDDGTVTDQYNEMLSAIAHVATDPHVALNAGDPGFTFPARDPRTRIDHLFEIEHVIENSECIFPSTVTLVTVNTIVAPGEDVFFSDHLGVAASLDIPSSETDLDVFPFDGVSCSNEVLSSDARQATVSQVAFAATILFVMMLQ